MLLWLSDRIGKTIKHKQQQQQQQQTLQQQQQPIIKLVHPGGKKEVYDDPITAIKIMEKYPGTCVTKPDIFHNPNESLLSPLDLLIPGEKYLIVPSTTIEKLLRKHQEEDDDVVYADKMKDTSCTKDVCKKCSEGDYFCCAKDFYVSKEKWCNCLCRREEEEEEEKKPFLPPIQKPREWIEMKWEPTLDSILEISP